MPFIGEEQGTMALDDWRAEGQQRFGDKGRDWKFVCPSCGNVASCKDVHEAGGHTESASKECIGRYTDHPCDWAAYGLFQGPCFVELPNGDRQPVFAFADGESRKEGGA